MSGGTTLRAQTAEGDLVYKFQVDGVHDHASAKALQQSLLAQDHVRSCEFIAECQCFKLGSSVPLSYGTLKDWLHDVQRALNGPVDISDGTVLVPQHHPQR